MSFKLLIEATRQFDSFKWVKRAQELNEVAKSYHNLNEKLKIARTNIDRLQAVRINSFENAKVVLDTISVANLPEKVNNCFEFKTDFQTDFLKQWSFIADENLDGVSLYQRKNNDQKHRRGGFYFQYKNNSTSVFPAEDYLKELLAEIKSSGSEVFIYEPVGSSAEDLDTAFLNRVSSLIEEAQTIAKRGEKYLLKETRTIIRVLNQYSKQIKASKRIPHCQLRIYSKFDEEEETLLVNRGVMNRIVNNVFPKIKFIKHEKKYILRSICLN